MQFTAADQTAMIAAIGTAATLETSVGASVSITVDYRPENSVVNGIITDRPTARMVGTQLEGIGTREAVLIINGVEYRIIKPQIAPDGFMIVGLTRI